MSVTNKIFAGTIKGVDHYYYKEISEEIFKKILEKSQEEGTIFNPSGSCEGEDYYSEDFDLMVDDELYGIEVVIKDEEQDRYPYILVKDYSYTENYYEGEAIESMTLKEYFYSLRNLQEVDIYNVGNTTTPEERVQERCEELGLTLEEYNEYN